jgi:predicted metal-dependent hydrolase
MGFDFSNVPKDYMNGSLAESHFFDGLSLLFLEGERFFMRAVRNGLSKINDENLRKQARGFFGQETQHAIEEIEHKAIAFDVFTATGGSYPMRVFGYLNALLFIHITSTYFVKDLLKQDGYSKRETKRLLKASQQNMLSKHPTLRQSLTAYFKPSFHPNDIDESGLVGTAMQRLGIV